MTAMGERVTLSTFSDLRRFLPDLALSSVLINTFSLAVPLTLLQIYDRIIPHQSASTLGLLVIGVLIALVLDSVVRIARNYVAGWVGASFEHKLSMAAFRHLLDAAPMEYERDGAGVHVERFRAATQVREFYSGQALLSLFDLPFSLLYLILIWVFGGWLVLVPLLLLVVFTLVAVYNGYRLRDDHGKRAEFDERRFSFITEALSGIHSVKSMAMEPMMQRRYEMLQESNVKRGFDGSRHSIMALNLGSLFSQLTTVSIVAVGALYVVDGNMTPGALAACIMLGGRSLQPVQGALGTWVRFQNFLVAKNQIVKLFEIKPARSIGCPDLPGIAGSMTLENVTLKFPGAKTPLFAGLNLDIGNGECIAVLGDSGSGKSSLIGLMNGLLVPSEGRVNIDGQDISKFNTPSVARRVGTLPQQGVLFQGTILENITMFEPERESRALEVAQRLGLDRVVAGMRNGYDTVVSVGANETMPAGVRQRIAIARALVHDPQVVLFDEANIAVDTTGDDLLRLYLESLKGKRTMVLVTHRPSLLKMADRIYTIKNGKLLEGRHETQGPSLADGADIAQALERPPADEHLASNLISRFRNPSDLVMCLTGLLTALGWRGNLRHMIEALPHLSDTLDLSGLRRIMANLNYTCQSYEVKLKDFDSRLLPALYLPEDGDGLVLLRHEPENHRYQAFNGGTVQIETIADDQGKGSVHVFRAADPNARAGERESWLSRIFLRFHGLMWLTLAVTLGINLLTLAGPAFIMLVYNRVIPSGAVDAIPLLVLGLLLILGVDWLLRHLRARILSYIGARGEFIVGSAIFQRIMALPAYATEQTSVGGQIARIKDFETLRDTFVGPLALLFYELPGIVVFVVALAIINPWMLVVLLISLVAFAILGLASQPALIQRTGESGRAAGERQEFLSDGLGKLRAIHLAGAEDMWYARFRLLSARAVETEFRSFLHNTRVAVLAQALGMVTGVAVLSTCVVGAFSGATSVGAVVASMIIVWRLITPLQNGFLSLASLVRMVGSIRQVDNLMRLRTERDMTVMRKAPPSFKGDVAFARTSFRYSNDADPALLGVSLRVEPGKVVAIAGPNGAGKSTLLKLVTGIYLPQAGSVRIDNIDIRQIDPGDLRACVAYAPQRCDVFYGTVAQNMRLVHPTASDDEVRWAVSMAGMYDDIMAMPEGFNTRLMDGHGDQLPNGFRQRLSLARAYVRTAPVMLFDEPGNGLDNEGDLAFQRAIERLRGTTTILLVTHRPSHLRMADSVVYMEEGYIRQVGSYDQVKNLVLGSVA